MDSLLEPPVPQRLKLPWSHYQRDLFDFVANGKGNAVVIATAGSGKTSSLLEALNYTSEDSTVAFVAFNKNIANELKSKAPDHVHVSTLHSLGLSNIRNSLASLGKVKVDKNKTWKLIDKYRNLLSPTESEIVKDEAVNIKNIVSLSKATLSYSSSNSIKDSHMILDALCDRYGIHINSNQKLIYSIALKILGDGANFHFKKKTYIVDFDDMIWYNTEVTEVAEVSKFDWLFIDEGQDLNAAQIEMVYRSTHKKSRVIVVADPNQSIYAFNGAELDAVEQLTKTFDAVNLPLSISYRCPVSHVKLAQSLVPSIESAPNAIKGTIDEIEYTDMLDMLNANDLVICRTNAPLVPPAFELIRRGQKAIILGRDIGTGLSAFVKKINKYYRPSGMTEFLYSLNIYSNIELGKLLKAKKFASAATLEDKILTLTALANAVNSVDKLSEHISRVFSDQRHGITFGTIHKIKGGEAERVFLLEPDLIPHKMANSESELQQERNIQFIAYTRSKSELYFVNGKE